MCPNKCVNVFVCIKYLHGINGVFFCWVYPCRTRQWIVKIDKIPRTKNKLMKWFDCLSLWGENSHPSWILFLPKIRNAKIPHPKMTDWMTSFQETSRKQIVEISIPFFHWTMELLGRSKPSNCFTNELWSYAGGERFRRCTKWCIFYILYS